MERRNFGFLLKDASRRYVARFEQHAAGIALTLPQCKVLVRLEKNEGVSQARLAELAEIEPMSMVRILDRMQAAGWIERRPDPDDRRARRLYLTARARPLLERVWSLAEATLAEAFAGIAAPERDRFIDLLARVHGNLCALDARAVEPVVVSLPARRKSRSPARRPGRMTR
jgi:DNA-binding MarR family transcriptional regulator